MDTSITSRLLNDFACFQKMSVRKVGESPTDIASVSINTSVDTSIDQQLAKLMPSSHGVFVVRHETTQPIVRLDWGQAERVVCLPHACALHYQGGQVEVFTPYGSQLPIRMLITGIFDKSEWILCKINNSGFALLRFGNIRKSGMVHCVVRSEDPEWIVFCTYQDSLFPEVKFTRIYQWEAPPFVEDTGKYNPLVVDMSDVPCVYCGHTADEKLRYVSDGGNMCIDARYRPLWWNKDSRMYEQVSQHVMLHQTLPDKYLDDLSDTEESDEKRFVHSIDTIDRTVVYSHTPGSQIIAATHPDAALEFAICEPSDGIGRKTISFYRVGQEAHEHLSTHELALPHDATDVCVISHHSWLTRSAGMNTVYVYTPEIWVRETPIIVSSNQFPNYGLTAESTDTDNAKRSHNDGDASISSNTNVAVPKPAEYNKLYLFVLLSVFLISSLLVLPFLIHAYS